MLTNTFEWIKKYMFMMICWNILFELSECQNICLAEILDFMVLAFGVSILITLILKITIICFKINDLLECIVKLLKIHKTQVGEDQGK